jgi:RHS repeat-associated protein
VHSATLVSNRHEAPNAARFNSLHRTSQWTMNGVPLSPFMVFDSLGRPSFQSGPSGSVIHDYIYAGDGWLFQDYLGTSQDSLRYVRDGAGHVLQLQHVSRGSFGPTDTNAPSTGKETDFTWRPDGLPATTTTHGVATTFTYDPGSLNVIQANDTLGRTVSFGYDARGNVTSTSDGTASASFLFDANNRLTVSQDGFSNATTLRYTRQDCGCSEKDEVTGIHTPDLPDGVEWTMTYGPQGRLATVTDPDGFTENYAYETTGEIKSVVDRLSRTATMSHDQLGRLLATVDTMGRAHQRSYSVPVSGVWSGPTLTAASADGTAATTSLSSALRSGDYQIGFNAYPIDGFPAPISLYRDATVAISYQRAFDDMKRLTSRTDRVGVPIDSATLTGRNFVPTVDNELFSYDPHTNAPLIDFYAAQRFAGNATSTVTRNVELDAMSTTGFGTGLELPATYSYTRDIGGRVLSQSTRFSTSGDSGGVGGPSILLITYGSHYTYYADGRLSSVTNADGAKAVSSGGAPVITEGPHNFAYDARGQLATQTDFDGTYTYGYDALGRNTRLDFPDGHARVQVFDDLGRITSRCYEYAEPSLNRCYTAQYDPVGNPVVLTDPEGSDSLDYDAVDRLVRVTRVVAGVTTAVEDYAYNGVGALSVNAGVVMDQQRPRLDGGGLADAPVPNTLGGQPITLDPGGRITSLRGVSFTWDQSGTIVIAGDIFPGVDTYNRRVWNVSNTRPNEFYLNEGPNRIAVVAPSAVVPQGFVNASFLYDGIDQPLRIASWSTVTTGTSPAVVTTRAAAVFAYYEIDLAGNVRRLRAPAGADLGGYRYTAFGKTLEDTVINAPPPDVTYDLTTQPLRWKGRPRDVFGGVEFYDMRAREWSPELGSFVVIDEYAYQDPHSTLWGWPGQNPLRWRDPTGRFYPVGFVPWIVTPTATLTAPFAGTGAVSIEAGIATATALGAWGAFTAATAGIVGAATYDIMTRLDDLNHPTVTYASDRFDRPTGIELAPLFSANDNDIPPPFVPKDMGGGDDGNGCDQQYRTDLASCRGLARRCGADKASRCYESALNRKNACDKGDPIPPLHGWW